MYYNWIFKNVGSILFVNLFYLQFLLFGKNTLYKTKNIFKLLL